MVHHITHQIMCHMMHHMVHHMRFFSHDAFFTWYFLHMILFSNNIFFRWCIMCSSFRASPIGYLLSTHEQHTGATGVVSGGQKTCLTCLGIALIRNCLRGIFFPSFEDSERGGMFCGCARKGGGFFQKRSPWTRAYHFIVFTWTSFK